MIIQVCIDISLHDLQIPCLNVDCVLRSLCVTVWTGSPGTWNMQQNSTQTEPSHRFWRPCCELIALTGVRRHREIPWHLHQSWLDANCFLGHEGAEAPLIGACKPSHVGCSMGVEGGAWERLIVLLLWGCGFASSGDEAVRMHWLIYRICLFMFHGGAGAECLLEPEDPCRYIHGSIYWLVKAHAF